jgi:hypothetical protein
MAPTSTAEAILTLATEIREGNTQLIMWLQQSSERQERQGQATITALHEISKGQERIMQIMTESTQALATMLLESQALTARTLELTRDIHTRTAGGSGTTH